MNRALPFLLVCIALVAAGCGTTQAEPGVSLEPLDDREPLGALTVAALDDGAEIALPQTGTPTVINFWASWCGPCRAEMPDLVKLADEREDIAVVGLQHDDTVEAGRAFADELGISFPLAREDGGLYDRLGLVGLPVTVFVDAEGRVASTFRGVLTPETLDAFVDELGA